MSEYQDFIIDLGPATDGQHPVRILDSPSGNAEGGFLPPFDSQEMQEWNGARRSRGRTRDLVAFKSQRQQRTARQVGEELFGALFQGAVRDRYISSLERVQNSDQGLRLKIRVDPEDTSSARLHSLPWEYLFHSEKHRFLARSRATSVVRYLDVPQPPELPPAPERLRILTVMSNPRDTEPLDLARERKEIKKVWRAHPVVEVDCLPRVENTRATTRALRRALLAREYHVLHFMGHGAFDRDSGLGALFFETDHRDRDPISGASLAELLADFDTLRLVVINACHSAKAVDAEGGNPYTGVATALVQGGVPAVVAMQAAISDRAAIAFSREFYHRLAAGDTFDAAVVEGRRAIGPPEKTDEWGLPVLFLRARQSRPYQVPDRPGEIERPRSWSWHPRGVTSLTVGALSLALLFALGYLPLAEHVVLRNTLAVILSTFGAIAALLLQQDPTPGRMLSHWVGRRRTVRWSLFLSLPILIVAWVWAGPGMLCRSTCGELCAPAGSQRIAIGAFQDRIGDPAGQAARWLETTPDELSKRLRLKEGILPLEPSLVEDERVKRCVDVHVEGDLSEVGDKIVLSADLFRGGGMHFATAEARGTVKDFQQDLAALQTQLVLEILQALGVESTAERQRIVEFPTANQEALELNRLGVQSFFEGDLLQAASRFEAALEHDPNYTDAVNNLGLVKLEEEDYASASLDFARAIELLPQHPSYHFNLGLAHGLDGRLEDAVEAYEEVIRLAPSHGRAYNNLGFVLHSLGDPSSAAEALKKGLAYARGPELQATLHKNLGRVAQEQKKFNKALDHLRRATELYQPYPEALFYLAVTFEDLGRVKGACATWRDYVTHSDHDEERRLAGQARAEALECL